jgi:hypothetical protein
MAPTAAEMQQSVVISLGDRLGRCWTFEREKVSRAAPKFEFSGAMLGCIGPIGNEIQMGNHQEEKFLEVGMRQVRPITQKVFLDRHTLLVDRHRSLQTEQDICSFHPMSEAR